MSTSLSILSILSIQKAKLFDKLRCQRTVGSLNKEEALCLSKKLCFFERLERIERIERTSLLKELPLNVPTGSLMRYFCEHRCSGANAALFF
jgi:hypothetical protein